MEEITVHILSKWAALANYCQVEILAYVVQMVQCFQEKLKTYLMGSPQFKNIEYNYSKNIEFKKYWIQKNIEYNYFGKGQIIIIFIITINIIIVIHYL